MKISEYLEAAIKKITEKKYGTFEELKKKLEEAQIKELIKIGFIQPQYDNTEPPIKDLQNLLLSISSLCQLQCKYCFAQGGTYGKTVQKNMDFKIAKAAIDLLIENSGNSNNLMIGFTGGEPLLNFKLIKQVVDYCEELGDKHNKKFIFGMSTNGLKLNPNIINFILEKPFYPVISLDGPQNIHDKNRPLKNGRGSYRFIAPKLRYYFQRLKNKGRISAIRAVLTEESRSISFIIKHLMSLGADKVYIENLRYFGEAKDYTKYLENLRNLYTNFFKDLLVSMYRGEILKHQDFLNLVFCLAGGVRKVYGCNAAIDQIAVSTTGEIYPCERLIGKDSFLLGNVYKGIDEKKREYFLINRVDYREICRNCWAKYACGGGCYYIHGGYHSINKTWCSFQKHLVELAICAVFEISALAREKKNPIIIPTSGTAITSHYKIC